MKEKVIWWYYCCLGKLISYLITKRARLEQKYAAFVYSSIYTPAATAALEAHRKFYEEMYAKKAAANGPPPPGLIQLLKEAQEELSQ